MIWPLIIVNVIIGVVVGHRASAWARVRSLDMVVRLWSWYFAWVCISSILVAAIEVRFLQ